MLNNVPAVVVTNQDGEVISRNLVARRILGGKPEGYCWDVVGQIQGAEGLPCRYGCVMELLSSGLDRARRTEFKVKGRKHHLSCIPVDGSIVCVLTRDANDLPAAWQSLTSREQDVLELLASGKTTSSVAACLGVSESTIRSHVEKMRVKLGVKTRAALVANGFRLGYLD